MNNEKLNEVLSDEVFVLELCKLESAAAVQAALSAKGVVMSEADILAIRNLIAKIPSGEIAPELLSKAQQGELPEELLDQIAGGVSAESYAIASVLSLVMSPVGVPMMVCCAVDDNW